MKKNVLIGTLLLLSMVPAFSQTTATNFTANDCGGTSHNLFSELNAGKVVVIAFIMPCGSCVAPSLAASNKVKTYASSNPGKVVFYLSDDVGTTSCSTLSTWANTNGLSGSTIFANTAVKESVYGSGGMPKIVVLGGSDHKVYYNKNGAMDATAFQTAINTALAASSTTGIDENNNTDFQLNVFPNPATENISVDYVVNEDTNVHLAIYNVLGEKVEAIDLGPQTSGIHKTDINVESIPNGTYFLKLDTSTGSKTFKFAIVNH